MCIQEAFSFGGETVLEIEFIGDGNSYRLERNYNGIRVTGIKFSKEKAYGSIRRRRMGQVMED